MTGRSHKTRGSIAGEWGLPVNRCVMGGGARRANRWSLGLPSMQVCPPCPPPGEGWNPCGNVSGNAPTELGSTHLCSTLFGWAKVASSVTRSDFTAVRTLMYEGWNGQRRWSSRPHTQTHTYKRTHTHRQTHKHTCKHKIERLQGGNSLQMQKLLCLLVTNQNFFCREIYPRTSAFSAKHAADEAVNLPVLETSFVPANQTWIIHPH